MTDQTENTSLRETVRTAIRREVRERLAKDQVLIDGQWCDAQTAARRQKKKAAKSAWITVERLLLAAGIGLVGLALLALTNLII